MPNSITILQDANGVWNVDLDTLLDGRKNRISGTLQQCLRACRTYEPDKHVEWISWADQASTRRINAN